ncbi:MULTISPECIES: DUF261 family protein [Borreliella]|uniref:DUF261 family protein n=3 Tax=Borreliella TaxID=64895 RepID=UPI002E299E57|nr:DUF261 family protein [Borreliella bavariensis]WLN24705.1 DUF261 family protein [Borreliella bavariensis]
MPLESDILIAKYKDESSSFYHFVIVANNRKTVIWDSLGNSKAVSNGYIDSLRVFKIQNKAIVQRVKEQTRILQCKI